MPMVMTAPMLGSNRGCREKPFCGNCCGSFKQGSGNRNKRIAIKMNKVRERRLIADLLAEELYDENEVLGPDREEG